jgi:hypothetical protein
MDPEEKEKSPEENFGKVVDALHNKQKLSSLRTYQGDMAQFIRDKNESVITVAVKEKERKEERIESGEEIRPPKPKNPKTFKTNILVIVFSFLFIGGGVAASFYLFKLLQKEPVVEVAVQEEIIPYNNLITLSLVAGGDLGAKLTKLSPVNGINIIKITDTAGMSVAKVKDFFKLAKISLPGDVERSLKDEYAVGAFSQNGKTYYFLAISVDDFGRAFSAMLDWEEKMPEDLAFLNFEPEPVVASSTATTTEVKIKATAPKPEEVFFWKDAIVKNKDTRGFINKYGQARIAYTFLDKNTILIVNGIDAIGEISSAYASRSVAR